MKKGIYSKEQKYLTEQLKKARKESGLDQKKVSEKLGTTQSYVSKLESGQRKVDALQLRELSKIYKKSLSYFLK